MTDRPSEIVCDLCGLPVPVKPSGRVPSRHQGGCPSTGATVNPELTPADVAVESPTMYDVLSERMGRVTDQVAPDRYVTSDGLVIDGHGWTVDEMPIP